MTLKEYIHILTKSIGEVKISTSNTPELNTLTIEDKIVSFDSKILVSHVALNNVKYNSGNDMITITSSIKVPKTCKWVGVFKVGIEDNDEIGLNLNIISVGEETIDVNDIMDDEIKSFIKL